MTTRKRKPNGKARPLVVERKVRHTDKGRSEAFAFIPGQVRTTADVLALLDDAAEWVATLETLTEAKAPRKTLLAIAFDVRNVVGACAVALREGHFPHFEFQPAATSDWGEAARKVLAWTDPTADGWYQRSALRHVIGIMERGHKSDEDAAAEAAR